MQKLIFIIIVLLLPGFLSAKKLDSLSVAQHKELYLDWDNDVFVYTDHYYSQGLHLYWVNPLIKENPLNRVLLRLKSGDTYFGIGLVQEMYTPKDIIDTLLNTVDRPYAGTLFLRSYIVSANPDKRLKMTTQFDLGILGPLSGARQAQELIHDWTGSSPPEGWDFQVDNRPYINYNLLIEYGLFCREYFELIGNSRLRAGNIHDDIRLGIGIRSGKMNNYFEGLNLANRSYGNTKDLEFLVFGNFNVNLIAYNATLMGGIIPPESAHQFDFNDIENFVVDIQIGTQLSYKNVGIRGKLTWKSKEFATAEDHSWGTVSLFFRL